MKNTRYSIGRNVGDQDESWFELLSESRIDIARQTRDSLNRARADHNRLRIKKIVTTEEFVD